MFKFTATANISKSALLGAVGYSRNHTILIHDQSGEQKKYINERHLYGNRDRVSKTGVKLLVMLYFQVVDKNGFIREFDSEEAAKELGCSRKAIVYVLKQLHAEGYIAISKSEVPCCYNIFLLDYKKMYLDAANGGNGGYVFMSKEFLKELLCAKSMREVRSIVRLYIECNTAGQKISIQRSFVSMQKSFPPSTSIRQMKKAFSSKSVCTLFLMQTQSHHFSAAIQNEFSPMHARSTLKNACRTMIDGLKKKLKKLKFTEDDLEDVTNVALKFPLDVVRQAIESIYETHILPRQKIRSLGALVRTAATEIFILPLENSEWLQSHHKII